FSHNMDYGLTLDNPESNFNMDVHTAITNSVFANNAGGAASITLSYYLYAKVLLQGNHFVNNTVSLSGHSVLMFPTMYLYGTSWSAGENLVIEDCVIENNTVPAGGNLIEVDAYYEYYTPGVHFRRNQVSNNQAGTILLWRVSCHSAMLSSIMNNSF